MSEEKLVARSLDAKVRQRQLLLSQYPVDRALDPFVCHRGVRGQQREAEAPQILQRCSICVANEKKRSRLVGVWKEGLAREAELQQPPYAFVPQVALIGKQNQ